MKQSEFTFEISLSVLNHLGRNLYRSFITVLGEAISNSWDADAENIWIYIDKDQNTLVIKDDGNGMTKTDFQNKFLKIGYSKRKSGNKSLLKGRPFIGRKGIGKLALLSCAEKITILSKTISSEYIGGVIDNTGLTEAIQNDQTPDQYHLQEPSPQKLQKYSKDHTNGTILLFEGLNSGLRNRIDYLKKLIALYFRFSLLDDSFSIFVNNDEITLENLSDLADSTQLLWILNDIDDPYVQDYLINNNNLKSIIKKRVNINITGFIASVIKPSKLKIRGTENKATVDLFVNGRLREKDLLRHIPTTRVVESYLYGQIHYNDLDEEIDRFTSSREGIIAEDPKFKELLGELKPLIYELMDEWDKIRIDIREDGDPQNKRLTKKERKARELFNETVKDYEPPKGSSTQDKVNEWVSRLQYDAQFNFSSYADCFISENLIRFFIQDKPVPLSKEATDQIQGYKNKEERNKNKGNISIDIRQIPDELSYLSMDGLANLVDKGNSSKDACLSRDANEYKPIRDAMAHTALLTELAKQRLTLIFENIQARIKTLLS